MISSNDDSCSSFSVDDGQNSTVPSLNTDEVNSADDMNTDKVCQAIVTNLLRLVPTRI